MHSCEKNIKMKHFIKWSWIAGWADSKYYFGGAWRQRRNYIVV